MSDENKLSLMHLIPFLARNCDEIRQWTIREIPLVVPNFGCRQPDFGHQLQTATTFEKQSTIKTSEDCEVMDDWSTALTDTDDLLSCLS